MGQLPPKCPTHPFLQFPDDLPDRSTLISRLIDLMSKKVSIPQTLSGNVADSTGLAARLAPFLIWTLRDDNGLELFICHGWLRVIGIQEAIYQELCWEFFSTVIINNESRL